MKNQTIENTEFHHNQTCLKIKAMSLAAENKIIKQQERKQQQVDSRMWQTAEKNKRWVGWIFMSIHRHRLQVVNVEYRATEYARAFLRGRPAWKVEQTINIDDPYNNLIRKRFIATVIKYSKGSKAFNGCTTNEQKEQRAAAWFDGHFAK